MRKLMRGILIMVSFPIMYPVLVMTFSVCGLTLIALLYGCTWIFAYFGNDEEWMESCRESFKLGFYFTWAPFVVMYRYYRDGKYDIEI